MNEMLTKFFMTALATAAVLAAIVHANAQQLTPEQNVASMLGSQLGLCFQSNAALQNQIIAAQAEIKALKDKYEKPAEEKK
jgi:hypothetical protein